MPINVLMPALSPTMTEGKLARWLKKSGDPIAPGDVIAEIETDKATMEVEAVDEGRLGDIRVPEGTENVPVNTVIAIMLIDGEDPNIPAEPPAKYKPEPKHNPVTTDNLGADQAKSVQTQNTGGRIAASPLARRISRDRGIDLSRLSGTGPGGRIVKADVETGLLKPQSPAPQATSAPSASIDARRLADLLGMNYQTQPNSGVRKTIAKRLTEAKQTIPHFYLTVDCAMDALNDVRRHMNDREEGHRLSVNDFIIKACAMALKKVPAANAAWTDSDVLLYENADISVAVATDNGLITPIVRNAQAKPVTAISREMKDLGHRARAGKLKPEEYQGGTFSVSNLGMFGIGDFVAIINSPQACILAVGAGEQRAVVRDGRIEIATMMTCTLSVDHRAVDGAVGAQYLAAFKKLIEDPISLLL